MGLVGTTQSWASFIDGYGSGYGYGYGYGEGDGSGSGYGDVLACDLPSHRITVEQLQAAGACSEGVAEFENAFPDGATYPDDLAKARELGLDVGWISNLGLFVPEESNDS